MNICRIHEGAKFQYTGGPFDEIYTVTIKNIAILTEDDTVETRVYFSNDHSKHGQELHMMTPLDFHKQLNSVNAIQLS